MNYEAWLRFLYPFGFLPTALFGLRFLIQWIHSERKKSSVVPKIFWQISLIANLLMCVHTCIQVQYLFCIIQASNAVISYRNLDLLKPKPQPVRHVLLLLGALIFFFTSLFLVRGLYLAKMEWMRIMPWKDASHSLLWDFLGLAGSFLFALRFWMQWWESEGAKRSFISSKFWTWSILGAGATLIYCIHTGDVVNIIGYSMGIVPYMRNLVLIRRSKAS